MMISAFFTELFSQAWAYRKEKIRGAERNLPDFFGLCPTSAENFFPKQINFGDPPPSPKKFRSVYHFRGPKFFRTYQNFSKHQTNFPNIPKFPTKLTEFPTKLTELRICPTYFYNKPILPDCEANIARLAFLPNKLRPPPLPAHVARFQIELLLRSSYREQAFVVEQDDRS